MIGDILEFLNGDSIASKGSLIGIKIIFIIIIGFVITKVVTKSIYKYLDKKDSQQSKTIKSVVGSIVKYFVYFFVLSAILSLFKIDFWAVAGISVAVGFGAQTFVKDVINGAFILFEEQFQVDDVVNIEGYVGRVEAIGLRTTTIRNVSNNEVYIIPNGEIKTVTNKTKDFQKVNVLFKLQYNDDLNRIEDLIKNRLKDFQNDGRIISEISTNIFYDSTDPVLNVGVSCSVENNMAYSVKNDLTTDLVAMFKEEEIKQVNPMSLNTMFSK